jgi:multiple sugar transport system substrate-binding protein
LIRSRIYRLRTYLTVCCWFALGGIVFSFLAACSAAQSSASTPQPTQKRLPTAVITRLPLKTTQTPAARSTSVVPTPEASLPELKGQVVQFWTVREPGAGDLLEMLVKEFNETNRWGIQVKIQLQESSGLMDEALESALIEKKLPNLLSGYSHDLRYWQAQGIPLVDLEPFLADPATGLTSADLGDFYPVILKQDVLTPTVKGQPPMRLGLPWYRSGLVMVYNQSWAESLGFPAPPATPAQFRQQACAAAQANQKDENKENNGTGGWLIKMEPADLLSWFFAFGGEVENAGGAGYQFDTPAAADALTFIHELYAEQCAWQMDEPQPQSAFASRQALFITLSLTELSEMQSVIQEQDSTDHWTILPFPSRRGGAFDIYGPSLALPKSTSQKQMAAWLFARWLVSPETQARWVLTSGTLPTRASVLPLLREKPGSSIQWQKAIGLLPYAQVEPADPSWRMLRWALADALGQILTPDFKGEQIPAVLEALDQLAEEVQTERR